MTSKKDRDTAFVDLVWRAIPEAGKRQLEENMSADTLEDAKSELAWCIEEAVDDAHAAGEAKGRRVGLAFGKSLGCIEGKVEAVLTVLETRGIDIPNEAREHITGCSSTWRLSEWVRRAATADSVNDLFEGSATESVN